MDRDPQYHKKEDRWGFSQDQGAGGSNRKKQKQNEGAAWRRGIEEGVSLFRFSAPGLAGEGDHLGRQSCAVSGTTSALAGCQEVDETIPRGAVLFSMPVSWDFQHMRDPLRSLRAPKIPVLTGRLAASQSVISPPGLACPWNGPISGSPIPPCLKELLGLVTAMEVR